jgi:hypothetical protein
VSALVERACDYLQDLEAPFTDTESEELCSLLRSVATLSEIAPIPPQVPPKPMPYPTKEEIALYRDTFRRELDKRMDTKHRSASPSTESHEIALRQFVENRNAP